MEIAFPELAHKIKNAPLDPGCYIFKDPLGGVLYVGKAVVLRNRVGSYFANYDNLDTFKQQMVLKIHDVEFVSTDSELEALILETNLIKKYRPKYNSLKKDDKSYVWLMIDRNQDFPRISVVREKKVRQALYLGPYPSSVPVKRIMSMLRKVFSYRTCTRSIEQVTTTTAEGNKHTEVKSSDPKPCLYYYLGLCQAPCAGLVSKRAYNKNIASIKLFFKNKKSLIIADLREQMRENAAEQKFEEAAKLRDKLQDLDYISQKVDIDQGIDESKFAEEKRSRKQKALAELIAKLQVDKMQLHDGFKIECYDISNIQGKNAVASMVVFVDGAPAKKLYRKFKIRTQDTPDDFLMMREVLSRRFKHRGKADNDESFSILPDLVIIDGGKGQLSSAYQVLAGMELEVPVIGLAKKNEDIFQTHESDGELQFSKKNLRVNSEARFLIQRVRDEAHRFGIGFHRQLRSAGQTHSQLDDIPGIGEVVKKKLLRAFGSVDSIKHAKDSELLEIVKNRTTVANIRKLL